MADGRAAERTRSKAGRKKGAKKARKRAEHAIGVAAVLERSEEHLVAFTESLERAMNDASDQLERAVDATEHEATRAVGSVERMVADARDAIDVHVDGLTEVRRSFGQRLDAQLRSLTDELESNARGSLVTLEHALGELVCEAAAHAASQASLAEEQTRDAVGRAVCAAEAAATTADADAAATTVLVHQFTARLEALEAEVEARAQRIFASLDALEARTIEPSATAERDPEPTPTDQPVADVPITSERVEEPETSERELVAERTTPVAIATVPARAADRFAASFPVRVVAQLSTLDSSARALARTAADQRVRVEVVHRAVPGSALGSFVRLTVHDVNGCWEYHDVPAQADSLAPRAAVLDLAETLEALGALRQYEGADVAVHLSIGDDVTIGNTLILARDDRDPELSFDRKRIERIDLHAAGRDGLTLETQLGRIDVPPRLISLLRSRQASGVELVTIDGAPCVSALVAAPTPVVSATIIARLPDAADESSELTRQRRVRAGDEIAHLVSALSADTSADELERILSVGVGYTRRLAAAHPRLPGALVDELVTDGTDTMRAAAASNPNIGADAMAGAVADESPLVRAAIAGNPRIELAQLGALAADTDPRVRATTTANPTMTPALLRQLAGDEDSRVRVAVAAHAVTETDVLRALADDVDPDVCTAIAGNPNCPVELLDDLAAVVPEAVMASCRAPAALLTAGSRIQSAALRRTVAANPATPAKVLDALSRDHDAAVLHAVIENPSALATARRRATRRLDATPEHDAPQL
ncbi:MAG TPA: hypothetical protein VFZ17_00360 [Acidimicrobiia bacterium]|nr:hypothetical protein [Acidimicrobiia bacterium]